MATGTATAPARNGRAAPPKFQPGFEPEVIALKAIPGKGVTGYSGDQVLFHLTDNRPWYAEIYVAQKIEQARIQAGEPFEVSKVQKQRGGRTITEVDVKAVIPEDPTPSQGQSAGAGSSPRETANRHQLDPTPSRIPVATASVAAPAAVAPPMNSHGETSKMHLTRCYQDAVDVAMAAVAYAKDRGLMIAPEFADLRAMAATICISESGRR